MGRRLATSPGQFRDSPEKKRCGSTACWDGPCGCSRTFLADLERHGRRHGVEQALREHLRPPDQPRRARQRCPTALACDRALRLVQPVPAPCGGGDAGPCRRCKRCLATSDLNGPGPHLAAFPNVNSRLPASPQLPPRRSTYRARQTVSRSGFPMARVSASLSAHRVYSPSGSAGPRPRPEVPAPQARRDLTALEPVGTYAVQPTFSEATTRIFS